MQQRHLCPSHCHTPELNSPIPGACDPREGVVSDWRPKGARTMATKLWTGLLPATRFAHGGRGKRQRQGPHFGEEKTNWDRGAAALSVHGFYGRAAGKSGPGLQDSLGEGAGRSLGLMLFDPGTQERLHGLGQGHFHEAMALSLILLSQN